MFFRASDILNYSSISFYINVDIYSPNLAQVFPSIQVLQSQIELKFLFAVGEFSLSLDIDPYLMKNEIEVV
jgi:hypothetical protein